ncbi:uncharacterized protein LOC111322142 isoform X2 [Stylophora pistillata]|uniref:uncharacterized protein LOC111322142 isoform X2 n=1 Tax=Stylophora pistillata TaxID=50429 RepID=UPI000C049DB0|nr:uncharacterized protein LOC111322142 isoform X2 [Stylophora pistillata]
MLGNLAKSRDLRVFALLLLFIGTPKGRQIYGRAKAVEAERGIKTKAWDDVIDYNPEIHHERDNEERDEGSSDIAKAKRTCDPCAHLHNAIACLPDHKREKVCQSFERCVCDFDTTESVLYPKCNGCIEKNTGRARF